MTARADRVWLIGAGHMGQAMLTGWALRDGGLDGIVAIDPAAPALPGGGMARAELPMEGAAPDLVVIAVKPQLFAAVAPPLRARLAPSTGVVSVMAGTRIASIRDLLGERPTARAIPNLAVSIGKGVIALYAEPGEEAARRIGGALMAPLGTVEWVTAEDQLDVATAVAGSGPAFVYRFIDALAQAAIELGLPAEQADRIALAMVEGAAASAAGSGAAMNDLAARVASKGGTTEAGLRRLDDAGALRQVVLEAVTAAYRRSIELAERAS